MQESGDFKRLSLGYDFEDFVTCLRLTLVSECEGSFFSFLRVKESSSSELSFWAFCGERIDLFPYMESFLGLLPPLLENFPPYLELFSRFYEVDDIF